MRVKRIAVLGAAALLLAAVGCADAEPDTPAEEEPAPVASGETATLGTLPVEPGLEWEMARYEGTEPLSVTMPSAGPWVFPSAEGWTRTTTQIVDPADVPGIEQFSEYDFVVRTNDFGDDAYYVRSIADGWMLQLGRVAADDAGTPSAEPYEEPLKLWPVDFEVGEDLVVLEGENFRVDATIVAQSSVTVPAGVFDDAYLVRFTYTPLTEGAIEGAQYYILAPDAGVVAVFGVSSGDEASGFTALEGASVLVTMPEKR